MGFMAAIGECCVCYRMFSFNPELVPTCGFFAGALSAVISMEKKRRGAR